MKKLRSKAGETLTETLVALLIGTIALAMLASMIGSTTRILKQTDGVLKEYYSDASSLAVHDESVKYGSGTVSCSGTIPLCKGDGLTDDGLVNITYYSFEGPDGTVITTYERGTK